jgi:tRNA 2-thiouridine synthesizing protein A
MTESTPDQTLDARGLKCPLPVVKTSKAMKDVPIGGILQVLATDPGSPADITAWAKSTGNELLQLDRDGDAFRFYIRRVR